ncbi:MAG: rRNA (uracil1498-N3)-methyltransferase [Chloroflexota bacterium]|nr:rRNA (uracil1498-N3)-methyltransferase [Chloroflexota bacterium]
MSIQRFFLPQSSFGPASVSLPHAVQHQLKSVLRMEAGDEIIALDPQGMEYRLELVLALEGNFTGKIISQQMNRAEARTRLTLCLPLTQREKFEWVLQKGTEAGVAAFQPLVTQRALVQDSALVEKKRARWEAIIREAAEQCGRGCLPELKEALSLKTALEYLPGEHDACLAAWVDEAQIGLVQALKDVAPGANLAVLVGPEGGFDPLETQAMCAAGVRPFSLGARVLRMETAAILAPALILYHLGDLQPREAD